MSPQTAEVDNRRSGVGFAPLPRLHAALFPSAPIPSQEALDAPLYVLVSENGTQSYLDFFRFLVIYVTQSVALLPRIFPTNKQTNRDHSWEMD